MSGLQDFLAPFSHLLFANRDKAIVVLAMLLGWFTIQLLIARWRNERLQRDLQAAKSAPSTSSNRRYAASAPVEEAPAEGGALPPVKGGRTYARNLGSALSKAGISSSQQIYSPPSPQGWAPTSNPAQAGLGQPTPNAPYAPPNAPWGGPAQQQPTPWGYPAAPGRPMPPQAPSPAPFYQPQAPSPMPPQQPAPMPPMTAPPSVPGFFAPSGPPAFAHPAFGSATSGPAAPAPPVAQPSGPLGPPMAPPFGNQPVAPMPSPEPPASDGDRRGKPKRRRFNFNVLENLEKMVQTKAEPLPPIGWQPPAGTPTSPAAPAATVLPSGSKSEPRVLPQPAPSEAPPQSAAETPSLPLPFGQAIQDAQKATEPETTAIEMEPPTVAEEAEASTVERERELEPSDAVDGEGETSASVESEARVAEVEPEPQPEPQPTPEPRRSMREMLFGEEIQAPAAVEPGPAAAPTQSEPEPPAAPTQPEPEPAAADWSWRPTRWEPAEDSAPTRDREIGTSEAAAEQPVSEEAPAVEAVPEPAPVAETHEPEPFAPWKSSYTPEAAVESEPAKADAEEAPGDAYPDAPASDAGSGGSAGTVVIIEDDETAANYYATLFRGNGYRVEVANDGVSGVDVCTRVQPQVILLDVMMPRQNGILVLQTLRASDETKNTPVVVMSNFSEPTLIKRAIQLGALEYVIKTQVEGAALLTAMPRWMNREKAFAAA